MSPRRLPSTRPPRSRRRAFRRSAACSAADRPSAGRWSSGSTPSCPASRAPRRHRFARYRLTCSWPNSIPPPRFEGFRARLYKPCAARTRSASSQRRAQLAAADRHCCSACDADTNGVREACRSQVRESRARRARNRRRQRSTVMRRRPRSAALTATARTPTSRDRAQASLLAVGGPHLRNPRSSQRPDVHCRTDGQVVGDAPGRGLAEDTPSAPGFNRTRSWTTCPEQQRFCNGGPPQERSGRPRRWPVGWPNDRLGRAIPERSVLGPSAGSAPPPAARARCRAPRPAGPAPPTPGPSPPAARGRRAARPTSWASRAPVSSLSGITTAAPARSMNRALAVWWSAVAYGYGIEHRGLAVGGDLEDRAARRAPRRGRSRAAPRRIAGCSRAGRSAAPARPVLEVAQVALAGGVQDAEARAGERLDRRVVDRARALGAAEHEHARLAQADPEARPGGLPVGGRRRDRAGR